MEPRDPLFLSGPFPAFPSPGRSHLKPPSNRAGTGHANPASARYLPTTLGEGPELAESVFPLVTGDLINNNFLPSSFCGCLGNPPFLSLLASVGEEFGSVLPPVSRSQRKAREALEAGITQRYLTHHPSGPGLAGAADGLNPGAALCTSGFTPLAEQGSEHPRRKLTAFGDPDWELHAGLSG